ncbi:DUF6493 family protein [Dactylosporangium sp. CS-047395]|uniref:DUF6493 family protein n=1 Tax=Dactylosporangium sp. CS-047395 TaxID=3239936 RepID=UPI003D8D7897
MVPIDEVYRRLRDVPEDGHWYLMSVLWQLDPAPPATKAPASLQRDVERVVEHIAAHWPQRAIFTGIRTLERLGEVTLNHDEPYVLAMISALGDRWDPEPRPTAIRADQELRESLLWRAFEVEGGGEVSLTNVDKYSHAGTGWADTLRTLAADGTLPRSRLLHECLRALSRDFSAYRAGFFAQLYTTLTPTKEELDQPRLIRLLSAPIPATVAFAVRHLTTVDKAGGLDDPAFVNGAGAALTVPAKNTPLAVLTLLTRIRTRHPALTPAVTELYALGLEHQHRDVQHRALTLLQALDARDPVAERLDLLEPTIAREATTWLQATTPPTPTTQTTPQPTPAPPEPTAAPGAAAGPRTHSTPAADLAHPSPVTAAVSGASVAAAVERSVDERVAALLAGETTPYEIELFLADVAAGRVSGDLKGPARKVLRRGDDGALRHQVAALVLGQAPTVRGDLLAERLAEVHAIATGKAEPRTLLATPTDAAGWIAPDVLVARLAHSASVGLEPLHHDLVAALLRIHPDGREIALRAASDLPGQAGAAVRYALGAATNTATTPNTTTPNTAAPNTAAPNTAAPNTDATPNTATTPNTAGTPNTAATPNAATPNTAAPKTAAASDAVAGGGEVVSGAGGVDVGQFLRAPIEPKTAAVWIAAARARAPLDDDPVLIAAGLDKPGQGQAASIALRVTVQEHQYKEGPHTRTVRWCEQDLRLHRWAADQPTVASSSQPDGGPDWILWAAQIWPHDAEVFCAAALEEMLWAAGTERAYSASATLDALAVHPGRMGPLAAGVLVAGMTAAEIGHRTRAAEAFAALVPDRLDPALVADAMVKLAHHATASRWASALRSSAASVAVLAGALPRLPRDHPGLHTLLTTLHEESVRAGKPPASPKTTPHEESVRAGTPLASPELRAWLEGFTGTTKAAKTARAILREQA